MSDDNPEKLEEIRKCLSTLSKLRMQITGLKNLNLDGVEIQYTETAFMHTERIRSCLNTLRERTQENKDQSHEMKEKRSRSVKA